MPSPPDPGSHGGRIRPSSMSNDPASRSCSRSPAVASPWSGGVGQRTERTSGSAAAAATPAAIPMPVSNKVLMMTATSRSAASSAMAATALGPQYIKDVRAPLPQLKLMPTGGVSPDNAGDWIRAGAVAVAAGSSLLDAAAIESGRFEVITANARRIVENVAAARGGK